MAHISLTREEIATLIHLVEKGSYLHGKLSRQWGDRTSYGVLHLSTRDIDLLNGPLKKYTPGARNVKIWHNKADGLVYVDVTDT